MKWLDTLGPALRRALVPIVSAVAGAAVDAGLLDDQLGGAVVGLLRALFAW